MAAQAATDATAILSGWASRSTKVNSSNPATSSCGSAGTHIHPGLNVDRGGDDTLFAIADGRVKFDFARGGRKRVNVIPVEQA